ncbi:MAG: T9SS type A sorting domain-containing protein [Bacteroidia bacterium]|nr:T9SS type A sorting domain-containing protein [Bacteroidia bacterium]
MRKVLGFIFLIFLSNRIESQSCPDGMVYIHSNPIKIFDPSQPFLLGTNPSTLVGVNTMTAAMGGLGYGPNANSSLPAMVFYTTIIGMYHWWNGSVWVTTGHSTTIGNTGNLAVGPGCIYNFNVGTGDVYLYTGSSNATLLFTVPGWFSSAGVADIAVDNCCNVYVMKTFAPQSLSVYSPTGMLLSSCSVSGMPSNTGGGGLAIVGNYIVTTSSSGAVYVGTISGSTITFTNVAPNFGGGGGDLASCPISCNGSCSTVLPIEFISFNCQKSSNKNALHFETAIEQGVSFFEIERSLDAVKFDVVGKISAKNRADKYVFIDETAISNTPYYYRIAAVELTGQKKLTSICYAAENDLDVDNLNLYPNPCNNEFYFDLNLISVSVLKINVIDMYGRIVKSCTKFIESGKQKISTNINELSNGPYSIHVSINNQIFAPKKVFKIE